MSHTESSQRARARRPSRNRSRAPQRVEEREVRSADPRLSPETNARVTEELREVVGSDRVAVPADRPHPTAGEQPRQRSGLAYLTEHRIELIRATAIVLTFGAVIALITNDWWLLPLAAGIHALGTMAVAMGVLRLTSIAERPSPSLGAALEEEGVSSPDERFSEVVEEFLPEPEGGASQVLAPGRNRRTVEAGTEPLAATSEQSTAMTPTAEPSEPAGGAATPDFVNWGAALGLFISSIVIPPLSGGGCMWLLTAIMVPLVAGWAALQAVMVNRGDGDGVQITSRKPVVGVLLATAIAVAGFCAAVAFAFQH